MDAASSKVLTRTDVERRFDVPIQWVNEILPPFAENSHELQFEVIDGKGFHWEFCCSTRKTGEDRKTVLQAENWLKFVKYHKLKVGDKIILEKEVNQFRGTQFKMRAQKLNSQDQWVEA